MAIRLLRAIFAPTRTKQDAETHAGKRSRLRVLIAAGCLGFIVSSAGCTNIEYGCRKLRRAECIDDFMIGHRNSVLAAKAWYREKHCYQNHGELRHVKAGFIAGYIDVATGGNGCTPNIAPAEYWGWRFQNANGQAAVNAWFSGFPLGARAAEKEGISHWGQIRPVGLDNAIANSEAYAPAPIGAELENPFGDGSGRYPQAQTPYEEVMPGEAAPYEAAPYLEQPFEQQPFESEDPEVIIPKAGEVIGEPEIAPPAAVETPPAPSEGDSAGTGFQGLPPGAESASEDLVPQQDYQLSEDLIPAATIGDWSEDVNANLSEVFGEASELSPADLFDDSSVSAPEEADLPFTFE